MRKVGIFLLLFILLPQVVLAAWWNPFSWGIFEKIFGQKKTDNQEEVVEETNYTESEMEALLRKVEELEAKVNKEEEEESTSFLQKVISPSNQVTKNAASDSAQVGGFSNSELVAKVAPSVVYIKTPQGSGSGVVIDNQYVLTNAHVVEKNTEVEVVFSNGNKTHAMLWGIDEYVDLALLKLSYSNLKYLRIGNSSSVSQGDNVYAFGFPLSSTLEYIGANAEEVSFKEGTLSRRTTLSNVRYLEMSAEIHPGNSGGPLVDSTGSVIGINTVAIGRQPGERIKWAIDIDYAKPFIQYMREGRQLWKNKNSTDDEALIRRELTKFYNNFYQNELVNDAVNHSFNQSIFSYLDSNLPKNDESIKRNYLEELIKGSKKNSLALEALKGINQSLHNNFLATNQSIFSSLTNGYQKKVLKELTAFSLSRVKQHNEKFSDNFSVSIELEDALKDPSKINSVFLTEQKTYLLETVRYIEKEHRAILDLLSNKNLF